MVGAIAEFERELMLERQREGIANSKAAGKYRGRAPTARAKLKQIRALQSQSIGASEIARRLGIGRASVYRLLGSQPAAPAPGLTVRARHEAAFDDRGGFTVRTVEEPD